MTSLRSCKTCAAPFTPRHARHVHCAAHEPTGRASRSPTTQAQDAEYKRERRRILKPHSACHWCGAPATTADHLTLVAAGGGHIGNLVPACAPCNSRRNRAQ